LRGAAAPSDVVATAAAELAGTSTSATYGAPYNKASSGQQLGPLSPQRWGGVRIPIDSARDLVSGPLSTITGDIALTRHSARGTTPAASSRRHGPAPTLTLLHPPPTLIRARSPRATTAPLPFSRTRFSPSPGRAASKACWHPPALSTSATRPNRCSCSPTVPTWRTSRALTSSAATSGE
jgi:hypothetical protein